MIYSMCLIASVWDSGKCNASSGTLWYSLFLALCYGLEKNEYEGYWLTDFCCMPRHYYIQKSKQTSIVITQSMGIIVIKKSKETRAVTYTCRYSNGHFIPIIQSCQDELLFIFPCAYTSNPLVHNGNWTSTISFIDRQQLPGCLKSHLCSCICSGKVRSAVTGSGD